jgi:hypothetical protein
MIFCITRLVGFGRACNPVRCAHLSFWALKHAQRGATLLLIYPPPPPKLPLRPELGPPGAFTVSFHWAKLHSTELHCILLSYAAPS